MDPVLDPLDPGTLREHARAWTEQGLLSPDQVVGILDFEEAGGPGDGQRPDTVTVAAAGAAEPQLPPLAEVFVYLGLLFAAVGAVFVVSRFWSDLPWPARLAVGVAVAVLGLGVGRVLQRTEGAAFTRLAGVADLAGTGGVALTAGIAAVMLGGDDPGLIAMAAGAAGGLTGLALWRGTDRPLQVLSFAAGLVAVVMGLAGLLSIEPPGWAFTLVLVPVGAAIVALGTTERLRPPTTIVLLGGLSAVAGAFALTEVSLGIGGLAAMAVAGTMVAVGLRTKRLPVTVLATLVFLQALTMALGQYLRGAGVAVALLVAGFAIVVLAVRRISPRGGQAGLGG